MVYSDACFVFGQNQLGILWAGRDEIEKAQGFLEIAESMYFLYMKEVCGNVGMLQTCWHNSLLGVRF